MENVCYFIQIANRMNTFVNQNVCVCVTPNILSIKNWHLLLNFSSTMTICVYRASPQFSTSIFLITHSKSFSIRRITFQQLYIYCKHWIYLTWMQCQYLLLKLILWNISKQRFWQIYLLSIRYTHKFYAGMHSMYGKEFMFTYSDEDLLHELLNIFVWVCASTSSEKGKNF